MKVIYLTGFAFATIFAILLVTSCEDMLDADQSDVLPYEKNYQNSFDSRSVALGILGLFQQTLADQYVLLGELRADLLDVTGNANKYMRQLSTHQVDSANPYTSPRNFYRIILSCNDALKNMLIMKENNRISASDFNKDYSEVAGFRCWVYYLLALHFGSVPYVTESLENIDMIEKGDFPVLSTDNLIDELVNFMLSIPTLDMIDWGVSLDGYTGINRAFVDKTFLLGDLYLWQGKYEQAASLYKSIMDVNNDLNALDKFKCSYNFGYNRPAGGEFTWAEMFKTYIGGISSGEQYKEWRWFCIIDKRFDQTNSLVKFFSYQNGDYLLKPSRLSVENWESQLLSDGRFGDLRGPGASWSEENGYPVVQKYLFGVQSPFDNDADLFVYRTGTLHLRYAEAVNRLGMCRLALAILNPAGSLADDEAARNDNWVFDFSSLQIRKTNIYAYRDSRGLRGRCYLAPVNIPSLPSLQDSILYIEDLISHEYALELAYEGDRWHNLLRIANRREKEAAGTGAQFLANTVAKKFESVGDPATAGMVREYLMNPEHWYLPLRRE
jgi:hypothetical protein